MKKYIFLLILCRLASPVLATEAKLESIRVDTGAAAVQRGADTLMSACNSCHSLKYIRYRDLAAFGMDRNKIDGWRGVQSMDAALAGQMSDDAAIQTFGIIPPDLSLMTKAREGGANYVYSYLIGYYNTPEGITRNHVFPETKMPDVMGMSAATGQDQRTEIQVKARELVSFLAWAADPHKEERHKLGYYVIGYLLVLTTLLFFVKNQIWSRLK
ncbi:MAG: cytochrome C [Betaproteobacteria bacterium RBG_16_56_24]|nr:MAG: cytochrome C [Betaproteobacteria bacterium RBG_16_56_24]